MLQHRLLFGIDLRGEMKLLQVENLGLRVAFADVIKMVGCKPGHFLRQASNGPKNFNAGNVGRSAEADFLPER